MKIIGIHGQSRCGKDTVCQILMEEFPSIKFDRQGFADALKISAAKAIGLVGNDKELIAKMDDLKSEGQISTPWGKVSGRQFLQNYGTEAHRDIFGNDFWLDQIIPDPDDPAMRPNGERRDCDVLLIPDVRYQNEVARVVDAGGILWRVDRNVEGHKTGHASEGKLIAGWNAIIDNNGTIDDLRSAVKDSFWRIADEFADIKIERAVIL